MIFNEPNANEMANDPPKHSIITTRRDQTFPVLEPKEIELARRFGEVRAYERGEAIVVAGDASPGVIVILCGKIDVTQRHPSAGADLRWSDDVTRRAGRPVAAVVFIRGAEESAMTIPMPNDGLKGLAPVEPEKLAGIMPNAQHQTFHGFMNGAPYELAIAEFDDQGRCYDRGQMDAMAARLDTLAPEHASRG
jgi:hypothetical protein